MASTFGEPEPGLDRLEDLERAAVSLYVAQGREVKSLRGAPAATVLAKASSKVGNRNFTRQNHDFTIAIETRRLINR